ncbi:MAG TPA: transposase family protein [Phenylobacterium sp.]|nr:transposase family protein [Phenylobacterium sp.]
MATRSELIGAIVERYRAGRRAEKRQILDEFVAVTGYHRKHAIRVLSLRSARPVVATRSRAIYGQQIRDALISLWEASDRVCSKRLRVMIPVLLPALERHGRLQIGQDQRDQLLKVSPATMDRLLCEVRIVARGGQRRRAGLSSAVRRSVPVRTFADWGDPSPGFVEVDFVAHSGTSSSGGFIQTLVLTDIATGWTECIPVLLRDSSLVIDAIAKAQTLFPFALRGVDFDNDSAFMNELVVDWCRAQGLEVTRSRAYRKNDQAWVEQKNGAIVRRLVGYGRFEGLDSVAALTRLYAASRLHTNLLQPSFKLKQKTRVGARVIKRYHAPIPPADRVLAHSDVVEIDKTKLRGVRAVADPVLLLAEMRTAQEELGRRVDRRGLTKEQADPIVVDLQRFAVGLKTAWRTGEQRTTHRRQYRRRKPVPVRPGMLAPFEDQIRAWLQAAPAMPAIEVLRRLTLLEPSTFTPKHLRTVQRAVKVWRTTMARRLILEGAWVIGAG